MKRFLLVKVPKFCYFETAMGDISFKLFSKQQDSEITFYLTPFPSQEIQTEENLVCLPYTRSSGRLLLARIPCPTVSESLSKDFFFFCHVGSTVPELPINWPLSLLKSNTLFPFSPLSKNVSCRPCSCHRGSGMWC